MEGKISLRFEDFDEFVEVMAENVSATGMMIRTKRPKPVGTVFDFECRLKDSLLVLEGRGEVVWTSKTSSSELGGMGIRFLELSEASRRCIQSLMNRELQAESAGSELLRSLGSKTKTPGEPVADREGDPGERELGELQSKLCEAEADGAELRRRLGESARQLQEARAGQETITRETLGSQTRLTEVEAVRSKLETQLETAKDELAELSRREAELRKTAKAKGTALKAEREELAQKLERARAQTTQREESERAAVATVAGLEEALAESQAVSEELGQKLAELSKSEGELRKTAKVADLDLERAEAKGRALKLELEELAQKIERSREESVGLAHELEKATAKRGKLDGRLERAATEAREEQARSRALESDLDEARRVLAEHDRSEALEGARAASSGRAAPAGLLWRAALVAGGAVVGALLMLGLGFLEKDDIRIESATDSPVPRVEQELVEERAELSERDLPATLLGPTEERLPPTPTRQTGSPPTPPAGAPVETVAESEEPGRLSPPTTTASVQALNPLASLRSAVAEATERWAAAWSGQQVAAYLAAYSTDFEPPNGISLADWRDLRRNRLLKPRTIQVTLTELEVKVHDRWSATAAFHQEYASDTFSDQVEKKLALRLEAGGWKIVAEN